MVDLMSPDRKLMALQWAVIFYLFRRETPAAMSYLDEADALAAEQHLFADGAVGNIRKGWRSDRPQT
jgi:hypothetical protein